VKKWQIAAVVVAVIAVGVGAFFGGHAWGASGSSDDSGQVAGGSNGPWGRGDGSMPPDGQGGRNGGNLVAGTIFSADESGITVKTSDGSTKIILVSGSTSISLTTAGSTSDLKTGANVVVSGTSNTDGTVTATNIRLGDTLGLGGAPGGTPPSGGTAPSGSGTPTTQTTTQ
jgi:hypothetical protein